MSLKQFLHLKKLSFKLLRKINYKETKSFFTIKILFHKKKI